MTTTRRRSERVKAQAADVVGDAARVHNEVRQSDRQRPGAGDELGLAYGRRLRT